MEECRRRCREELEELRRNHLKKEQQAFQENGEGMTVALKSKEKETVSKVTDMVKENKKRRQALIRENEKRLESLVRENKEQLEALVRENEALLQKMRQDWTKENEQKLNQIIQEHKSQEVMMIAKHQEEERSASKAPELNEERRSVSAPPSLPECPVGSACFVFFKQHVQVCFEELAPPTRIFQCRNGHLLCETCK